jgi:hypothetical protein
VTAYRDDRGGFTIRVEAGVDLVSIRVPASGNPNVSRGSEITRPNG